MRFQGSIEELEPRLLFNADGGALLWTDPALAGNGVDAPMTQVLPPAPDATASGNTPSDTQATTQVVGTAAEIPAAQPVEIVFVDAHVQDAQALIDSIRAQHDGTRTLEVHWLQADVDGIQAITDVLQGRHDVAALHLISHGSDGVLQLGQTLLNADTLPQHAAALTTWQQALTSEADLLIYGCDVAASATGQHFLQDLGVLTGADVAASTDDTGAASRGGDWLLEYQFGAIESQVAPDAATQAGWNGLLTLAATGSETTISSTAATEVTATNRQVAIDSTGKFVVVWQDGTNIKAQRYNADGSVNGGVLSVSASGTNSNAQVAMNNSGAFVVVWQDSSNNVYFRTYTNAGVAGSVTTVAAAYSGSGGAPGYSYTTNYKYLDPTVAINTAGEFVVAYTQNVVSTKDYAWSPTGPTNDLIQFKAYTAAGAQQGTNGSDDVSSATTGMAGATIAMNGSGAFVVAWTDGDTIQAQRYTSGRAASGSIITVNSNTTSYTRADASAAIDDSGNFVVTWTTNQSGTNDIFHRRYNSAGTALAAESMVHSSATNTQTVSSIAMNRSTGEYAIVYQDSSGSNDIYIRQFDASGTATGAQSILNTTTTGSQTTPSIAVNGAYGVAAWTTPGTATSDVKFQRLMSPNTAPVNTVPTTVQSASEDVAKVFSSGNGNQISIADADAGSSSVQVTLTVNHGTLSLNGTTGLSFTVGDGTGDATMTFTGTVANINTALNGLSYTGVAQYSGLDTLTIVTDDQGNTGSGGALSDTDTVTLTVVPVNDPTVNTVPGAQSINEDGSITFSSGGGNLISVADADAGSTMQVTVSASHGTLTLSQTTGLTFTSGDGTSDATMTFKGSLADINAALAGMNYTATANYNGTDTVTITSQDATLASLTVDTSLKAYYSYENTAALGTDTSPAAGYTATNTSVTATNDATRGNVATFSNSGSGSKLEVSNRLGQPTNLTVASWVKVNTADTYGATLITIGDTINVVLDETYLGDNMAAYFHDGSAYHVTKYNITLAGTGWHHVAYSVDSTNNVQTLYLDGVAVASTNYTEDVAYTNNTITRIGKFARSGWDGTGLNNNHNLDGALDDTRVYNRALSAAEIATLAGDNPSPTSTADTDNVTVNIAAVNDAPVFVSASNFTSITEDQTSNSGQLVSTLFSSTDVDSGAATGIALYSQTPSNGTWQYSTNGGTNWSSVGTVSSSSALLLRSTDKLRFVPDGANADAGASISFYAWDQTSGSTGTKVDVNTRGNATAFSTGGGSSAITVTAVNDAPVLSGTNNLSAINEDNSTSSGTLVSSLISGKTSDVDTGAVTGIAVTAVDNTNGAWQYTTDGGSNWLALGTPSAAASRLLAANGSTSIRFVPNANWNGTATITYRAWDQSTGTAGSTADTSSNGGTTAFSSATASPSITVNAVNDAPVFVSASNFTSITEDQTGNSGQLVSTLFSSTDADSSAANGIAVYSQTPSNGTWQYSTDGGSTWTSVGTVSGASALLLRSTDKMRFVPDGSNADAGASLSFYVWDQTSGSTGTKVDASTRGTTTAFSSSGGTSAITVTAVNDAPVLSGTNNLTAINEDDSTSAGTLVSSLISGKTSDVDSGASTGIAVTSVDNTNGVWQYTTNGGSTWTAFGTPSAAASRLLAANGSTSIRFVPNANWNGTATITYRAWDQSTGTAGSTADTSSNGGTTAFSTATASPSITVNAVNDAPVFVSASNFTSITEDQTSNSGQLVSTLFSSTDADSGAANGIAVYSQTPSNGTWQYSTDGGSTWTSVGTVSGASALLLRSSDKMRFVPDGSNADAGASLSFYVWDQTSGSTGTKVDASTRGTTTAFSSSGGTSAITVTAVNDAPTLSGTNNLTAINEDDSTSAGTLVSSLISGKTSDVDSGASTGIAVTSVDNTNGTWQYTTNGGSTWTAFGTPSAAASRLLAANGSTSIRFVPNANWNGTATITYRAWDQSTGTAGNTADTSSNGGTTAFSSATASPSITVNAVNDAPVFVSASNFTSITEDQTSNSGQLVSTLFSSTDADSGAANGIAVYSQTPSNGTWQYSTDGGSTWTSVGTVSSASALLLRSSDKMRFVPDGSNADAGASLSFYVWDQTTGSAGSKTSVASRGGTTAFSSSGGTSAITVTAVNDAPVLSGTNNLTTINEDNVTSPGTLVSSLISGKSSDVDTGAVTGIAVTSVDNTNGTWQYTTDGGGNWTDFGTPSAAASRLLAANGSTSIRFVPNANWNGTATITYRAWDQSTGTAGNTADTSSNGGTTAFSSATASPSITVNAVNDAPTLSATAQNPTFTEAVGVASPPSPAVTVFTGSAVSTIEAGQTFTSLTFTVGGLMDGASEKIVVDGTAITLGANSSGTTLNNAMGYAVSISSGTATITLTSAGVSAANVQTLIDGITYQNTSADNPTAGGRTFTLTQIKDSGGTSNGGIDTTNVSIASTVTVAVLNDPPVSHDDVASTNPGVPIDVAVKANDSDPDNTTGNLTVTIVSSSAGTTATVNPDGTIHFDPGLTVGAQTVVYYLTDPDGLTSSNATLTVTVSPNNPPSGSDASQTINEDGSHTFVDTDFGYTDPDPGQNFGGITVVTLPANGSLLLNGVAVQASDVISAADIAAGRLVYTPVANESGTPYTSFTFKVMDEIGGVAVSANTFTLHVNAVNDAPVLSTTHDFTGITEDQTSNGGQLVSTLIGTSDIDSGAVDGIAIHTLSPGNGTWQYSTDNGGNWSAIGVVDGTSALLLRATDRVRFVPDGLNADSASIGYYAWDQSTGTQGNKVDVSTRGGTTAYSSAAGSSAITVTAVNDAPVLTGTSNLASIDEDDLNGAGQLVSSIFTSTDVDQGAIQGIAVYGASTASGAWQYSLDGGSTWSAVGNVGSSSALLLRATDRIRFVPNVEDTDTATLDFLAWDETTGSAGGTADVTTAGGTTAFSASGGSAAITVTAVNDAPVLTQTQDFSTLTEDDTGNAGQLVSSLLTSTDVDTGAQSGIAIHDLSAGNGTWQYSLDGGNNWNDVGTVNAGSALLLGSTDRLRFVPDGHNADAGSVSFYAWDQSSGSAGNKVDVSTRGGTTAFSSVGGSSAVTVTALNDAPVLTGTSNFNAITEDDVAHAGQLVSSLFTATDVDNGATSGVAIHGTANSRGTWQFSTDGGNAWTDIGTVGDNTALLLRATDRLRFVPDGLHADSASLDLYAWDGTTGTAGSKVDASTRGTTTAFSTASGAVSITVTAVNDAPVLSGTSALTSIDEDDTAGNGQLVSSLYTASDVDSGAVSGIAVYGLTAGQGRWQYSLDGGGSWSDIGAVDATSALLLASSDRVRFVPDGLNADNGTLSFYAWDQSTGAAGGLVDASTRGGTTAFSATGGSSAITVTALNDAPVLTGTNDFTAITEDDTNHSGQLVSSLFNASDVDSGAVNGIAIHGIVSGQGTWQYSLDGGNNWSSIGSVNGTSALLLRATDRLRFVPDGENADAVSLSFHAWDQTTGTAGSKVDVSTRGTTTAFSSASGTSNLVVVAVNDAPVLGTTTDFTAIDEDDTANAGQLVSSLYTAADVDTGAAGGIALTGSSNGRGTWQYSLDGGTTWGNVGAVSSASALLLDAGDRLRFVPDGQNADTASLTFVAWDLTSGSAGSKVDASTRGSTTAFSTTSGTSAISVNAVNDAPVLSAHSDFTGINEDSTNDAGQLVSTLLTSTDVDSGAASGVAIYGKNAGNGTWQYSTDNGSTWNNIGVVSTNAALLLQGSDRLRFVPDGRNADTATLSFHAWDQTTGTAGGTTDVTTRGGSTAFSAAGATSSITVTALNDAPVLTGIANFTPINEDDTANAGQAVSTLIAVSDVDAGAASGIALYGTVNGQGTWQYSLDNGSSWSNVGSVSSSSALLLRGSDLLRFVPDGQNADTASLDFHAWDQTSGAVGSRVDAGTRGGTTPFSIASGTSSMVVSAVNDAPVLTGTPDFTAIGEDDSSNPGQLVSSIFTATDVDTGAATGIAVHGMDAGRGSWQYSLDNGTSWSNVSGVDATHALLLRATDRLRFVPDGLEADTASLDVVAWDQTTGVAGSQVDVATRGGSTAFSVGTGTSTLTINAVNDAPVLTSTANFATIQEDSAGNAGQLVSSLFSASDVDAGAASGIALFGTSDGRGSWSYSLDGGSTWQAVGSVDGTTALLLRATDRLRFNPDGLNADSGAISFHAWDQSTGTAGSKVDVATRGADTAFSTASGTATIGITAVNDAPVLTGTSDFATLTEDDVANAGQMVSTLFTLTDVDAGAASGIAVFGTSSGRGTWQYSLDGGTSWSDVGSVDASAALLLRATDRLRFVPDGLNADACAIDFYAWDQTAGTAGSLIDVGTRGQTTPFSTAAGSAAITVNAANDAPVLSGASDFTPITEDEVANAGQAVSTLIATTDVDTGATSGMAVYGLGSGRGTWQYSLDGGTSWSGIGSVDASTALLLRATDRLRFVPDGVDADTASLSFHAWDATTGTAGGRADVSVRGGSTAFSTASGTSSITVTAINDAPSLTATALHPTFTEAAGLGTQAAAVTLFGSATIDTIEASQQITSLSFEVAGLRDGADERITVDGTAITLQSASTGTTSGRNMGYAVLIVGDTARLTLSAAAPLTASQAQSVVTGLSYQNTNTDRPTAGLRTITLTRIKDDGGTAYGGLDTRTIAVASAVSVSPVNDAPTLSVDASTSQATGTASWSESMLLSGASDAEGDTLSLDVVQAPLHGVLERTGDGQWHYTANMGYSGNDSFSWRAYDGALGSAGVRQMAIQVTAGAPPVALPITPPSSGTDATTPTNDNTTGKTPDSASSGTPTADTPASGTGASNPMPGSSDNGAGTPTEDDGNGTAALHERIPTTGGVRNSGMDSGLYAGQTSNLLLKYGGFSTAQTGHNASVMQLLELIRTHIDVASNDINLSLTPLSSTMHVLPLSPQTHAGSDSTTGDTGPLTVARSAAYSTGLGLSIGTIWWTARMSGLVTSALLSTPAWRSLDPLPILASDERERPEDEEHGDRDVERLFDADVAPPEELPSIG
ncbi:MAG: Ig-like domain-containing protein [Aquabacterium sp.]